MTECQIFLAALHRRGPAERRAFLDDACGDDPDLRGRVEALLVEYDRLGGFLERPATCGPGGGSGALWSPGATGDAFGDFEIVREVARGGMGVVYEARQLSLGRRRVALKILPFAAAAEPRLLQRFRLEAQAAALLNHPHIVPVYGVGSERGVPYYAMQFIEGRTLADLIRDLRGLGRKPALEPASATDFTFASRLAFEESEPGRTADDDALGSTVTILMNGTSPESARPPRLRPERAVGGSTAERAFCRTIAHLGIQAAEALDHAHERGVVHRDIKPSNLMIDGRGSLWVTDFGLARLQEDPELTQSGDLLGTLQYMSPEQTLGRRAVVDHRTDVYSLGATLYELLTLEPAVRRGDRHEILRQVVEEEPRPVRQLNPAVPADLGTIVGKAMAKDPRERYGSARELADDLRRFLEHRPIAARPPSWPERAGKWARRHPATAALVLASLVASFATAWAITGWAFSTRLNAALRRAERAQRAEAEARRREQGLQYFLHIALAQAAWRDGDVRRVVELLDACPRKDRRWEWHYLQRLCHADLMTLRGHASGVLDVAASPDGTRLASASNDETIRVWDAASGEVVLTLTGHTRGVFSVAFSPDGARLLSAGGDGTARVWDARAGRELLCFRGHAGAVYQAAFHPDGQRAASAGADGTIRVWDTGTGGEVISLRVPDAEVWAVAFSPDGRRLATADSDGGVLIWEASTGDEIRSLRGHVGMVRRVAFSPDGTRLASAGMDRTIRVWDAATGREELTWDGHAGGVNSLTFSPDRALLASAGGDGAVRVWDLRAGTGPRERERLVLRGHLSSVLGITFSPDGRRLASAGADRYVKVWDAESPPEAVTLVGRGRAAPAVAISPDGRFVVSADDGGSAQVWDSTAGRPLRLLEGHNKDGETKPVSSIAFSADGRRLATGGWDDVVRVWDATTWRLSLALRGHARGITCVAFDPRRPRLASGSGDRTCKVWDLRTGREVFSLGGYEDEVSGLAYSRDGSLLAVASRNRPVTLHDSETGATLRPLGESRGHTMCVAFSADGQSLASGGWDQTVRVWDVATGAPRMTLQGHTEGILGLAFSADGSRLASAGADHVVKVWDLLAGREALSLRGHTNRVHQVTFSPDGGRLVSAGADGAVTIWDGRPLPPVIPTRKLGSH